MNKQAIIVYFSRTGYTRRVAEQIARRLNADLIPIAETGSRLGLLGYVKSLIEATWRRKPKIKVPSFEPAHYRLVVIGTPIWAWRLSSPVRTFISRYQWTSCKVAFFCTMGGSGAEGVFEEMKRRVGGEPLATMALKDADIDANHIGQQLDEFCQRLRGDAPTLKASQSGSNLSIKPEH
jgi:menaquinone-dependent protoporphyrinogen IX oxidase